MSARREREGRVDARRRRRRRWLVVLATSVVALGLGGTATGAHGGSVRAPRRPGAAGLRTTDEVVVALDRTAGARMRAKLADAGLAPAASRRFWLLGIKDRRTLELFGESAGGRRTKVRTWRVLAASGTVGPKLREGDRQVPEGVYRIDRLNPNSGYHLSLGLDYPSAADRARAARDGRTRLGGEIYIHGKAVSVGCLAIGDDAIEELFWLVGTVGQEAFTVVIAPTDLRRSPPPRLRQPRWAPELYRDLARELSTFP